MKEKFQGLKYRVHFYLDTKRWMFFAWLMDNHPSCFERLHKMFPSFTLPF